MINPYASSIRDKELDQAKEFQNGAFIVDGRSIVGGERITLPSVCVFTGATEQLASRTSFLWRFSLLAWLPCFVTLALFFVQILSYGWRYGPSQSAPLEQSWLVVVLSWLSMKSTALLIVPAGVLTFFLQRKTRIDWYLAEPEATSRRRYKSTVLVAVIGLFVAGYVYRPVAGWIVFLLMFHVIYSRTRFPRMRLLEQKNGFSRVSGFSSKFLESIASPSVADIPHQGDF